MQVPAYVTKFISGYLSSRFQRTIVDGFPSSVKEVTSGVPQGGILGPLLFLVFINDLPLKVTSDICLFADDTLPHRTIKDQRDTEALQQDLNSIQDWAAGNEMEFNGLKSVIVSFTLKHNPLIASYQRRKSDTKVRKHEISWNCVGFQVDL